jgi:phosphonoacetaldehyde hydrolase
MAPVMAMIEAFAAYGVAITEAEVRRDMGRAKREHISAIMSVPNVVARWVAANGAVPTTADEDNIHDALEPLIAEAAMRLTKLIPGAAEVIADLEKLGVKIGSGTGYTRRTMVGVLPRAAAEGYSPRVVVCSGETPSGRPAPFMTWKALTEMNVWPAQACVKVDDAAVGIEEGRNAGCWTIGVAASGNGVGLSLESYRSLTETDRAARVVASARQLNAAGADYVIDTVADIRPILDEIAARIIAGDRPASG